MGRSRISYVLRDPSIGPLHTSGINSLSVSCMSPSANSCGMPDCFLVSGGRDGTVNVWDLHMNRFNQSSAAATTNDAEMDVGSAAHESCADEQENSLPIVPDATNGACRSAVDMHDANSTHINFNAESRSDAAAQPYAQTAAKTRIIYLDETGLSVRASTSIFALDTVMTRNRALMDKHVSAPRNATVWRSFMHHSDWVNDVVVVNDHHGAARYVVSGSSDCTILAWDMAHAEHGDEGVSKTVPVKLGHHSDYVKRLAYATQTREVVSGGFDKRILVWDIQHQVSSGSTRYRPKVVINGGSELASVYALACTPDCMTIVSGSPEKIVRVFDTRVPSSPIHRDVSHTRLMGHTDTVRDLLVTDDGRWITSASSDGTIKVWDMRNPTRWIESYDIGGSVWCLYGDCDMFWAGTRDGVVMKTVRGNRYRQNQDMSDEVDTGNNNLSYSVVVCRHKSPVTCLSGIENAFVWIGTPESSIYRYRDVPMRQNVPAPYPNTKNDMDEFGIPKSSLIVHGIGLPEPSSSQIGLGASASVMSVDMLQAAAAQSVGSSLHDPSVQQHEDDCDMDDEDEFIPVWNEPDAVMRGGPSITRYAVLNNRRYVVTLDTSNIVTVWDVIRCVKLHVCRDKEFDVVVSEFSTVEWIGNWCTVDIKCGFLCIHVDENKCWEGETYSDDLVDVCQVDFVNEDQRICLGKWVVTWLLMGYLVNLFPENEVIQKFKTMMGGYRFVDSQKPNQDEKEDEYGSSGLMPSASPIRDTSNSNPEMEIPVPPVRSSSLKCTTDPLPTADPLPSVATTGANSVPPVTSGADSVSGSVKSPVSNDAGSAKQVAASLSAGTTNGSSATTSLPNTLAMVGTNSGSFIEKFKFRRRTNTSGSFRSDESGGSAQPGENAPAVVASPLSLQVAASSNTAPPTAVHSAVFSPSVSMSSASNSASPMSANALDTSKRRKWSAVGFLGALTNMGASTIMGASNSNQGAQTPGSGQPVAPASNFGSAANANQNNSSDSSNLSASMQQPLPPVPYEPSEDSNASGMPASQNPPPALAPARPVAVVGQFSSDETPPIMIPPNIPITISYEDSPEAPTYMDVFRSVTGDLSSPTTSRLLTEILPTWIRDWIMFNHPLVKDPPKVSFVLLPHPESKWPELPTGNTRLTANRMLRIRKVVQYVAEKLQIVALDPACYATRPGQAQSIQQDGNGNRSPLSPVSYTSIRIYCNDKLLSPRTTLATVKHHVWKSGADVPLYYL